MRRNTERLAPRVRKAAVVAAAAAAAATPPPRSHHCLPLLEPYECGHTRFWRGCRPGTGPWVSGLARDSGHYLACLGGDPIPQAHVGGAPACGKAEQATTGGTGGAGDSPGVIALP